MDEPSGPDRTERSILRRLVIAVPALAIAVAGFGLAVDAFRAHRPPPSKHSAAISNGPVVFVGEGAQADPGLPGRDLIALDVPTGTQWTVTATSAAEEKPVWSADGQRVAFFRLSVDPGVRGSHLGLYVQTVGEADRELFPCDPRECSVFEYVWSPDASRLALVTRRGVEVLDPETGSRTLVCKKRACGERTAGLAWSPDGTRLAWSESGLSLSIGLDPSGVHIGDVDGSSVHKITNLDCNYSTQAPCYHDSAVSWSPDGHRLSFHRIVLTGNDFTGGDGPRSMYLIRADGSELRKLGDCTEERCPRVPWAPTSASRQEEPADPNVLVIYPAGSGKPRRIRTCGATGCVRPNSYLDVSPDGRQVAFLSGRRSDLYVIQTNGRGLRKVATNIHCEAVQFNCIDWLPAGDTWAGLPRIVDGTQEPARAARPESGIIAFTADPTGGNEEYQIYTIHADGTERRQLTSDSYASFSPIWSPDGRRINHAHEGAGKDRAVMRTMDADGANKRPLGLPEGAISPDGTKLAFSEEGKDGVDRIWVMNTDGSGRRALTNPSLQNENWYPVWSPDGQSILFESLKREGTDLHVVDLDGGRPRPVTHLPGSEGGGTWSPDGKRIAFAWSADQTSDIYVINTDGSGPKRITNFGAAGPAWSPDGEALVFASDQIFPELDWLSGIYTIRLDDRTIYPVFDARDWGAGDFSWTG